jgi:hypothetical protein
VDLEATWQEHKRFIVSVGLGAVAFGILSMGVGGIEASADQQAKRNAKETAELNQAVTALKGQEAAEKGKKIAIEEKARPAIEQAVAWVVDKGFLLAEDDKKNANIAYAKRRMVAGEEVSNKADKAGAVIPRKENRQPELGFEDDATVEGARAVEALARCDVTRQVVGAALDAGVTKILAVRQPVASYEPLEGGAGFLRRIPVDLVFEGTTVEAARILAAFEVESHFLELGAFRMGRVKGAPAEEGRLEIEIELAALTIEKEAPADAATTGPSTDPNRRPTRRRRD